MELSNNKCCFCSSNDLTLLYKTQYHKVKKDHGPIDFYRCNHCGSGLTIPLPSQQQLNELYNSFDEGMDKSIHDNRKKNPLTKWYNQCIDHMLAHYGKDLNNLKTFSWVDIGAGGGELCKLMSERFPHSIGYGIDFHSRPSLLKDTSNVLWYQCNLNDENEIRKMSLNNIDVVFSITVLEHVMYPDVFIRNIISMLNGNGIFYLTAPDLSSGLARLSKKYWSYLLPGEHLNIPSKKGLEILLSKLASEAGFNNNTTVFVKATILPYPLSYYLQHFKLVFLAKLVPPRWTVNFPTGILEAGVVLNKKSNKE